MLVFQGKLAFKAFLFLIEASNLCFYFRGTTSNERPFEEKVWSSRAYLIYTRPYIFPYFSRGCAYLKHCKSLKQRTREPRSHPRWRHRLWVGNIISPKKLLDFSVLPFLHVRWAKWSIWVVQSLNEMCRERTWPMTLTSKGSIHISSYQCHCHQCFHYLLCSF